MVDKTMAEVMLIVVVMVVMVASEYSEEVGSDNSEDKLSVMVLAGVVCHRGSINSESSSRHDTQGGRGDRDE